MKRNTNRTAAHRTDGHRSEASRAVNDTGKDVINFWDDFSYYEHPVGGAGIDRSGSPLPKATLDAGRQFDANLFGAVNRPRWDAEAIDMVEPYGWGV